MTEFFTLALRLHQHESSEPVVFKVDGGRFENTRTIKLNAATKYDVRITLKPKTEVRKSIINGETQAMTPVESKDDEQTYICQYTTHVSPTKNGKREPLHIQVELLDGGYVKIELQCKMYKAGETSHSGWGDKLSFIQLDCKREQGQQYITVINEKYS